MADFASESAGAGNYASFAASPSIASRSIMLREGMTQRDKMVLDVFSLFDTTSNGHISADELPLVLRSLGLDKEHLSYDEVDSMRAAMDPERTGSIHFEDFLQVVGPCLVVPGSVEEQWFAFRRFDRAKKGTVGLADLVDICNGECNGLLSEQQCGFIMQQLKGDPRRQGITFDEWKRSITAVVAADAKRRDKERRDADDAAALAVEAAASGSMSAGSAAFHPGAY